jgi:hypothetical protein
VQVDYDPGGVVCTVDVPILANDEISPPAVSLSKDGEQPARVVQ